MGIFDRFSTLLRSNINDLVSRAENPEKMLNQLIVDMKSQLAKAKQQVASAIADEKKLQSDAEGMKKQAEDWERRAMLAVQEGRDDLAKQALGRYNGRAGSRCRSSVRASRVRTRYCGRSATLDRFLFVMQRLRVFHVRRGKEVGLGAF